MMEQEILLFIMRKKISKEPHCEERKLTLNIIKMQRI